MIEEMWVGVITADNGGCGDPECCGVYEEYERPTAVFATKEAAEYWEAQDDGRDIYGPFEVQ